MKRGTTMLTAVAMVVALVLPSSAQVRESPQDHHHAGTIETMDQSKRAMNIETADGKIVAVNVPKASSASQTEDGDKIKATSTTASSCA